MLECQDCDQEFVFDERDQEFFKEKGFTQPKRCRPCRKKRKEQRERQDGGRRGGRDRR
jgi:hypothetical protein